MTAPTDPVAWAIRTAPQRQAGVGPDRCSRVLLCLVLRSDEHDEAAASAEELVSALGGGVSRSSVQTALSAMVSVGLIKEAGRTGHKRRYKINYDWCQTMEPPSRQGGSAGANSPDVRAVIRANSPDVRAVSTPPEQPSRQGYSDGLFGVAPSYEVKEKTNTSPDGAAVFEEFYYRTYPKKVAPGAVRAALKRAVKKAPPEVILAGARRWRDHCRAAGTDPKYIPAPTVWLNQERWADDPQSWGSANPGQRARVPLVSGVNHSTQPASGINDRIVGVEF